jgi:hypothetical protein
MQQSAFAFSGEPDFLPTTAGSLCRTAQKQAFCGRRRGSGRSSGFSTGKIRSGALLGDRTGKGEDDDILFRSLTGTGGFCYHRRRKPVANIAAGRNLMKT